MEKTVWLLLGLGLVTIAECRNLNLKTIRRKRGFIAPALPVESERREVCIEDLGCYPNTNPGVTENPWSWKAFSQSTQDALMRNSRNWIATEFRWWAPGAQEAKVSTHREMNVDGFDPGLKVQFLVHGYQAGDAEWAKEMKDAFLRKEQCNVFIVDWKKGAEVLVYTNAVANTWVVGQNWVTSLFNWWKKMKPVGRITGLDPAGEEFYHQIPGERLNIGDAAFVDVIHTNWADFWAAGLGLFKPVGHFDFYPNGGADQPGCKTQTDALFSFSVDDFSCSHSRAIDLFIESIESESCKFMSDQCATSEELKAEGKCPMGEEGTLRVPMGYYADEYKQNIDEEKSKSFYLETNGEPPYCKAK
ncbi:hypothetical protein JTE90_017990 [Oedothorax gibbosus]|uniref:Lipase domain-containing protein n=1 Tax=Oedothorax gibbosus TaxID=931172 RepID=A0AAV6V6Z8_9ARAC|nr:hypothetical protein JTE90_017990 [Oedothorax gibbosus]